MASTNDRDYLVGATVILKVGTRDPESRAPLDPPTPPALDALFQGPTPVTLPDPALFTLVTPGEYRFSLDTTGFAPGAYTWRAKAVDVNDDIALSEDTFVLRAAT